MQLLRSNERLEKMEVLQLSMFKKVRFWLSLLSLIVIILNMTGQDDKNLLFFFTGPANMFTLEYIGNDLSMGVHYLLHIVFWFIVGWVVDLLISRFRRSV
ncbi:hypothetical protein ACK8P5_02610 [Paenibacillus sp. EC2-1]|uniref:hypothetical protein n=1 Tax=Paenibacillus sp. EC2-1 TaxID=3388665 RepID=UPI003BEF3970